MKALRRSLAAALALGCALLVAGGCNSLIGASKPELVDAFDAGGSGGSMSGPSCLLNSECPDTQICVFRVCSPPCAADKDCALAQRCLQTTAGNACVITTSASCAGGAECPTGSQCKAGACRSVCQSGSECLSDQVCVGGVCLGTDSGHDPASGGGTGGTGGSGTGGEAGAVSSEGGSSGMSGGSGGSAGSGGAAPECEPGYADCTGLTPLTCQGGKIVSAGPDCSYACKASKCSGECVTGTKQCTDLTFSQCDADNTWQKTTCASVCDAVKGCVGSCTIGALQCNGAAELDICTDGAYAKQTTCPVACKVVAGTAKCIKCGDADGFCPTGCKSPTDLDCPKEPGEKCSTGSDCRLGYCVNSVCCGTASCTGGSCFSCAVAGHEGTCTEVNNSTTSTDPGNCGACGTVCSTSHVTAACVGGACTGACAAGFVDCNADKRTDGCEINTTTDANNCGACNKVCSSANVTTRSCSGSVCNGPCALGFLDCDANKQTTGCETNGTNDPNNCGVCGSPCKYRECINSACAPPMYGGVVGPGPQSLAFSTGGITYFKITIANAGKLAALGVMSTTAGHKLYLGLYSDFGGAPKSLIIQTSELTSTVSGTEGILGTLTPVAKGDYWIALTTDAPGSATLRITAEAATTVDIATAVTPYAPLPATPVPLPQPVAAAAAIADFYAVLVP